MSIHQDDRTLPDKASPCLALVNPTEDEIISQSKLNGASWRGALGIEAYLRREKFLASQALSTDSGLTYWALVDSTVDKQERSVLAGCETLRKRALMWCDGQLQEVVCHGVGSVFADPAYRGKGYGARLIRELGKVLQDWQTSPDHPCVLSVLYSDIGKQFYAKHGWHPYPSSHVHLPPASKDHTVERLPHGENPVRLLYEEDLESLCKDDEELVKHKLGGLSAGVTAIALVPDIKTIRWHHARELFVSKELFGKSPKVVGAMTNIGKSRIWAIWTRVWQNEDASKSEGNTLHILRLVIEDESLEEDCAEGTVAQIEAIASLLRAAQHEAFEWQMDEVELWNPHARSVAAAQSIDAKARLQHRDHESITSLKWYGKHVDGGVIWLENEKYGWC